MPDGAWCTRTEEVAWLSRAIAVMEARRLEVTLELAEEAAAEPADMPLAIWTDYCACNIDPDEPTRAEREQDACDARDEDETIRSLRGGR